MRKRTYIGKSPMKPMFGINKKFQKGLLNDEK